MQVRDHHVVVIGAGFAGLFATRSLARAPVQVTVIDRSSSHLFQPLLYQVATGILSEGEIAPNLRDVLKRQANATVLLGDVNGIDLSRRVVTMSCSGVVRELGYDSLIVGAGSQTSYFHHHEFEAHAPGLKHLGDALELRGRIFSAFELAETEPDKARRAGLLTFVVIGAGATGVEMAGQIAELSRHTLAGEFRAIDPTTCRIVLVDTGEEVLANFGTRLSSRALAELERLGVEVELGSTVTALSFDGVELENGAGERRRIDSVVKIWAAGVRASALAGELGRACGLELDHLGRVPVDAELTLKAHREVFVVGDMMARDDLPQVAEVAIQSGLFAARTIKRRLRNEPCPPFRYRDFGSMAAVSRFRAVAAVGPVRLSGILAWVIWLVVHLTFLTGFKNRLSALFHWAVTFFGRTRTERVVVDVPGYLALPPKDR